MPLVIAPPWGVVAVSIAAVGRRNDGLKRGYPFQNGPKIDTFAGLPVWSMSAKKSQEMSK